MTNSLPTGSPVVGTGSNDSVGVTIEVRKLSNAEKKLSLPLQDISLYFPPRSLVAVTGPAGSGKSTLLEILAGIRNPDGGQVVVNGVNLYTYRKQFLPWIGYVNSQNSLHPALTVQENYESVARLRLPRGTRSNTRKERIGEVLNLLGITSSQNKRLASLAPFEQYLACLGAELLQKPTILLADEPCKPVDATDMQILLTVFRNLVHTGVTVIFVTQSALGMQAADRLVMLDRGGYLVWYGPPGEASVFFNTGDHHDGSTTELTDFTATLIHNQKPAKDWATQYKALPAYSQYIDDPISKKQRDLMLEEHPLSRIRGTADDLHPPSPVVYGSSFSQYFTLINRNIRLWLRDRSGLILALGLPVLLAAFIFTSASPALFSPVSGDASLINQLFATLVILVLFVSSLSFSRAINSETAAVTRERQINLRSLPYALSKFSLVVPVAIFQGFILAAAYSIATQFQGGLIATTGIFITLALTSLVGGTLGLVASSLASSVSTAVAWVLILVLPQLVFGGGIIPRMEQSPAGQAFSTVIPARYSFEAMVAASGYGTDVAQDACWSLPAAQRQLLTGAQKQNCFCLGSDIFQRCNFPGIRSEVTSSLDQPEPAAPIPDTRADQLPIQPLLKPGETLDQYANEINQYTLQLETYQGIVSSYLSNMQQYLNAAISWQQLHSYAIGIAEARIADQVNRYGPIYNTDLGEHWLILLGTSLFLLLVLTVIQMRKSVV